jgi:hypothetical protein
LLPVCELQARPPRFPTTTTSVCAPTLLPTSEIFIISASLWGFGLFCFLFCFFCIFFENHLR